MPLQAELQASTVPSGTEFPGTVQLLLELIAQYMEITGLNPFSGINFGDVEPTADERDRPWFKTDGAGNPVGWFSWNGSAWTPTPIQAENGGTASRPANPDVGQVFLDTDINVLLMWDGTRWTTVSGSPGDVKEVKAATIDDALTNNPGWLEDTDSAGQVIAAAITAGSGALYNSDRGGDTVMLAAANLPDVSVPLKPGWAIFPGQHQNGSQAPGVYPIVTGQGTTQTTGSMNSGIQEGLEVYQPTKYYWRLYKQ